MSVWIRENPQFAALAAAFTIVAIVLGVLTLIMTRSGASLRPLVWFIGFFGIVAGPQVVVHFLDGLVFRRSGKFTAVDVAPRETKKTALNLAPVSWAAVFGPDADPSLITDAKHGLEPIVGDAEEAKLSFHPNGDSALAARFATAAAAAAALDRYGQFFRVQEAAGSEAEGWTARRFGPQGDWVHVVAVGPELYAWTGTNRADVVAKRGRALGALTEDARAAATPVPPGRRVVSNRLTKNVPLMVTILAVNLLAASFWFFKGSAWAARVDGATAARPADVDTLRQRLLGTSRGEVPMQVTAAPDGSIEVNWRYADARWFDLMRVHQLRRTQRLVLHLDESSRTVRVREYWSAFDASLGPQNLRLDWKQATGIQFFALEHKRVFGAQLDASGRPTGELSKAYTFDLQAMKAPMIAAVTESGWRWQPVVWKAPAALRWLTE
ncbi:MAG TPA: hypothetical protein VHF69_00750 [Candidatus Synoicihabitans sp.]|nr:hypothetical protein [Candidatus Synoicihabitans sp.]